MRNTKNADSYKFWWDIPTWNTTELLNFMSGCVCVCVFVYWMHLAQYRVQYGLFWTQYDERAPYRPTANLSRTLRPMELVTNHGVRIPHLWHRRDTNERHVTDQRMQEIRLYFRCDSFIFLRTQSDIQDALFADKRRRHSLRGKPEVCQ